MSNFKLFEKLANDNDLNFLARLYDLYSFYSKYDHFSILYFRLIRQDFELCKKQFKNCIVIFLKHMLNSLFILDVFSDGDEEIRKQLVVTSFYCQENNS